MQRRQIQTLLKLLILFISGITGCTGLQKHFSKSVTSQIEAGNLLILASCEFYNGNGEVVRKYPGDICVPIENGDLYISNTTHLTKLDRTNQVIWSRTEPVHHQLKRSFNKRDIYFISGYLEPDGPIPTRQDVIKVVDSNGKTIRQFDFATYLKTLDPKFIERYRYKNTWSFNGTDQTFFEYTHINSIEEMTSRNEKGVMQLDGYLVNDRSLGRVFFFDPQLRLKKVINFDFEAMHDVSLLDRNTLIYFLNSNRTSHNKSSVVTFDLQTNTKKIIYGHPGTDFYSKHNGGVQPISPDLFLISHAPKPSGSYVELISIRGEVLKRIYLNGSRKLIQDAELADYREFLKNNIGN